MRGERPNDLACKAVKYVLMRVSGKLKELKFQTFVERTTLRRRDLPLSLNIGALEDVLGVASRHSAKVRLRDSHGTIQDLGRDHGESAILDICPQ